MKKDILLIGGGGHCNSCIDVIEQVNRFNIVGIIDQKEKIGQKVMGYEIIGTDDDLPELSKSIKNSLITIGQINSVTIRIEISNLLKKLNFDLPVIISPRAHVSKHSVIGEGTIIMHDVLINSNVQVGTNCIINSKVLIEHDSVIKNNCHISTGSIVNGTCTIGNNCFIGSGSVISNNCNINNDVILSLGSVVKKNIKLPGVYAGNPVRKFK